MHLNVHIVLANDFEHIDGQLVLSSDSAQQTAMTMYEMQAALTRYGISCHWPPQRPAKTMTARLLAAISWAVIQAKFIEIPELFTNRMPTAKVTLSAQPTLIMLDIVLSHEVIESLYQHGAPLFQ